MNDEELKKRLLANQYVDIVRGEMRIDHEAYKELTDLLRALASRLRGVSTIDKEVALALYTAPLAIRNSFLSFSRHAEPKPTVCALLEDHWIELDELVTECLTDPA